MVKRIRLRNAREADEGIPEEVAPPKTVNVTVNITEAAQEVPSEIQSMILNSGRRTGMAALREALGSFSTNMASLEGPISRVMAAAAVAGAFPTGGLVTARARQADEERARDTIVPAMISSGVTFDPDIMNGMVEHFLEQSNSRRSIMSALDEGRVSGVMRVSYPSVDDPLLREISFDPAEPGSDRTGIIVVRAAADVSPNVLTAQQVRNVLNGEPAEGISMSERLTNEYMRLAQDAVQREGIATLDRPHHSFIGRREQISTLLSRALHRRPYDELSEVQFWGQHAARIGMFLLSDGNGETMVGFNLRDPSRTMFHDLSESEPQHRRRSWAVGELIGWGRGGSRR